MKTALILFVRNPVLGKVKTRLAKTAGDTAALAIYKALLRHTNVVAKSMQCDKYVFYADNIAEYDIWENTIYQKKLQAGNDLGARMHAAFEALFSKGYQHICIIGSDCYELTTATIQQAFNALLQNDVVIGPSADGGYYLLGLSCMQPSLFKDIAWSTSKVLEQTIAACIAAGCSHRLLATLHDIDTEEDWIQYQTKQAAL